MLGEQRSVLCREEVNRTQVNLDIICIVQMCIVYPFRLILFHGSSSQDVIEWPIGIE